MMNTVDFVGCVVWTELAKNCRPTLAQIRYRVDSSSAPDCSGFWRSSEIQTRITTAHLLGTTTRGKVLFEMSNSRSSTGTQETPRLLWKPEFHNRVQNSLKEVHVTLSKTTFLRKTTFLGILILILSTCLQEIFKVASDIQVLRPKLYLSHAHHIPILSYPFEDEARTVLFRDLVGTAQ
jgi:hypothetical protein